MLGVTCHQASDLRVTTSTADGDAESRRTIIVLDQLLDQSIGLRNLYRSARWQTADIQYRRLRRIFDRHYTEQLGLVDVLIERIRTLGGGHQVFARNFLQGTQFARALQGNRAVGHLLNELLDAHESVLGAGSPNGSAMNAVWVRDFAVGQVVLINNGQSMSIREQLAGCEPKGILLGRHAGAALDCEEAARALRVGDWYFRADDPPTLGCAPRWGDNTHCSGSSQSRAQSMTVKFSAK